MLYICWTSIVKPKTNLYNTRYLLRQLSLVPLSPFLPEHCTASSLFENRKSNNLCASRFILILPENIQHFHSISQLHDAISIIIVIIPL